MRGILPLIALVQSRVMSGAIDKLLPFIQARTELVQANGGYRLLFHIEYLAMH